ncbi:MAG: helix-turn-helix domain-containing protein [Syntrophaceae bacterium]|nr:helix-turn-helix domain-containing protein [Syntrophaceae bacterium]
MASKEYLSTAQAAKALRISRIAVYKKIKRGEIEAVRIGRNFAIPVEYVKSRIKSVKGKMLTEEEKKKIEAAVDQAIKDYGEVLRKLGNE